MDLVKVKCAFCRKKFFRRKGQFNEAKKFNWKQYCSWKCLSRDKLKRQILFCENCGKRFERTPCGVSPHNYCSKSCAAIANNKKCLKGHAKIKPKFKTCVKCGKKYKKSTNNIKYCSLPCRRKAEQKTSEELIKIIKETAKKLKRVPARREMKESKTCQKIFGSWNNAIIAAGFHPNRSHSQRMYKRTNTTALDGHLCDSVSEALVDNWLTKNNISHERNVPYPKTNHKADWAISAKNQKIFVEYFGLANDSPRYDRSIIKKKRICQKNNLTLIPIYPHDLYPKNLLNQKLKDKFKNFINI